MKKKKKLFGMLLFCMMAVMLFTPQKAEAATSYTDAKTYYETCDNTVWYMEFVDSSVYFATKTASLSNAYKRFGVIGWQATVSGNGKSITMDFKINGRFITQIDSKTYSDGYTYTLYCLDYENLSRVANIINEDTWEQICKSSMLTLKLDAIATWKEAGSDAYAGEILREWGNGTLEFYDASKVWYLSKSADFEAADSQFPNQQIKKYKNVNKTIQNYSFKVNYHAGDVTHTDISTSGGFTVDDETKLIKPLTVLQNDIATQKITKFEMATLRHPIENFGLKKNGYRLAVGKEWKTKDEKQFYNMELPYFAIALNKSVVSSNNTSIDLVANWEPISYNVQYKGNGGVGNTIISTEKYDQYFNIITNPFYKENYVFTGWNTKSDGSGIAYEENDLVANLSSTDGETIVLYAQWEPEIYTINIVDDIGKNGTKVFYEKYGKAFSLKSDASTSTNVIKKSDEIAGYTFEGVYMSKNNKSELIINKNGEIIVGKTYFEKNGIDVYAHWSPKTYTITFNQQGGSEGTNKYVATYMKNLPDDLLKPAKKGYTFKGYYSQPNGQGTLYFNEYMNSDKEYDMTTDITLYAYWKDEELPTGRIEMTTSWTNDKDGVKIDVITQDKGSGLSKVFLNREDEFGDVLLSGSSSSLAGKFEYLFTSYCTKEGVYVHRVDFSDIENSSELLTAYKTARYDITKPTGEVIADKTDISDLYNLTIFTEVTDYNVQP